MMSITILFFGKLADVAQNELGLTELKCEKKQDTNDIRQYILSLSSKLYRELEKPTNLVAVNQVVQKTNIPVQDGDEIAFMSPLSGG